MTEGPPRLRLWMPLRACRAFTLERLSGSIIMSLNPDGAPAGFYYQAGATAYLIDPAGAYSPAGASAPTTDPAGTDGGAGASAPTLAAAGAYIPITGATSAAAEIVDPARAYSLAGASAPTTDPAGPDSGAGASAPTPAGPRQRIFLAQGRPPPRRRLSTPRALIAAARARRRPIRPAGAAPLRASARRSRPRARTFQ